MYRVEGQVLHISVLRSQQWIVRGFEVCVLRQPTENR